MSKLRKYLIIMIGLLIGCYGVYTYFHTNLKAELTNNASKSQDVSSTLTKKTKTTIETSDPLISCTNENDLCEEAILPVQQQFSYSDYIWANAGEVINFGGTSQNGNEIDVWVESDDGSFSSDLGSVGLSQTKNFTVDAPTDGNYRLVIENNSKNFSGSGYGYIKDAWAAK